VVVSKVSELEGTVEALSSINIELEGMIHKLSEENSRLEATLSDTVVASMDEIAILRTQLERQGASYQEYLSQKAEMETLAIYLRTNYRLEIKAGEHAGMTLSKGVIRYLARERNRWTVKLRYWWWELTNKEEEG
jgi:predicted RNase H-like nuclease (RuvC/YqgF family)